MTVKTIGVLGGMSWESTTTYYRLLNEGVKERLGGLHSASILLHSVDFAAIEVLQAAGKWQQAGEQLAAIAGRLEGAGADFLIIATNTMHRVADQVEAAVSIPLLHIADATGRRLTADKRRKVGLLGTRFTMEQDFYKARITEKFGIDVLVPDKADRQVIHQVIYDELCLGTIKDESREQFLAIIRKLSQAGAESVILGCTEIALLVKQNMTDMPLYDTTTLHCQAAVDLALAETAVSAEETAVSAEETALSAETAPTREL